MENSPFNKGNDPEGSRAERFEIRHALNDGHIPVPDVDREWERLKERLDLPDETPEEDALTDGNARRRKRLRLVSGLAAAAAVVGMIVLWAVFLGHQKEIPSTSEIYLAHAPEVTEVTVTSSHSRGIIHEKEVTSLSLAKISDLPAARADADRPEWITLETPAGKELKVTLSDSTCIWLWPNSRMEIPDRFKRSQDRIVKISGQAFFDVAKLPEGTSFIVETPYFNTSVYGTEFCVNAVDAQQASVTLVEGSIAVAPPAVETSQILNPGQRILMGGDHKMCLEDVDTYPVEQWRDGFFYYDDTLHNILVSLGRWYNVNVVATNHAVLSQQLHFVAERTMSLDEIIDDLSSIVNDVEIHFDGKQISVICQK